MSGRLGSHDTSILKSLLRQQFYPVLLLEEPEIVIEPVIQFQSVIDTVPVINIGFIQVAILQRMVVTIIPFRDIAIIPVFIVFLGIVVHGRLHMKEGIVARIKDDQFIFNRIPGRMSFFNFQRIRLCSELAQRERNDENQ